MGDFFRPTREPARTIYDALKREAAKRAGSRWPDWHDAELDAVWNAACTWADANKWTRPSMEGVIRADVLACGHVDYAAKLAYAVAGEMRPIDKEA